MLLPKLEEPDAYEDLPQHLRDRVDRVRRRLNRACGKLVFPSEYLDLMSRPGCAVNAPRQTGKTEALLWLLRQSRDPAIVVAPNREQAHRLLTRYREEGIQHVEMAGVGVHTFINASSVENFIEGNNRHVFCDEWWEFGEKDRKFLALSGRVEAAIGTASTRRNEEIIECLPLY